MYLKGNILSNKSFFEVHDSTVNKCDKQKIIDFYGTNKSWQEGIQIIVESIISESKSTFKLNFFSILKRLLVLYLLNLRKIIRKDPKPKKSKLITTDDLNKIINQEKLNIKIKESGIKSGIWEII